MLDILSCRGSWLKYFEEKDGILDTPGKGLQVGYMVCLKEKTGNYFSKTRIRHLRYIRSGVSKDAYFEHT